MLFCTGIVVGAVLGEKARVDIAASTMVEVVSDSAIRTIEQSEADSDQAPSPIKIILLPVSMG